MSIPKTALVFCWLLSATVAPNAQMATVSPQVRTRATADGKATVVEIAAHFVTAIRLPEAVNAVAVGDPALFQVEHSEREPELVLVKALTERSAETNLLISSIHGRQFSLLLVSRGIGAAPAKVDFLVQFKSAGSFLVEPEVVPFPLVGQTAPLVKAQLIASGGAANSADGKPSFMPTAFALNTSNGPNSQPEPVTMQSSPKSLDGLLRRQQGAPLPALYGERMEGENVKGDRLRAGISEVIDGGQEVIVLFSVMNTSKHAILLMPPQVQLGGKNKTGKIVKHDRWSAAEQLAVADFRLSRRRVGAGERADGVVVFERPPYKQSNETLFLQMAESGAVDRPALAPIGFGVSSLRQEGDHGTPRAAN
jgi:hypothetical protein